MVKAWRKEERDCCPISYERGSNPFMPGRRSLHNLSEGQKSQPSQLLDEVKRAWMRVKHACCGADKLKEPVCLEG